MLRRSRKIRRSRKPSRSSPRHHKVTAGRQSQATAARTSNRGTSRLPLVTLALEWFLNPDHLPFIVAKEQGFFREEGMDVSILIPTVPEESLELVARGKADFGVGEQTNL
ncbi:MAG TPA: ABC transporter substrate-binding protein, partial [Nitrospiraceae bacterium]